MSDSPSDKPEIKWITPLVLLLGMGLFLPLGVLAFYNHPAADDFLVAIPAMESGPITAMLGWYQSWSCRYSASFLLSISPLAYQSLIGYQMMAVAVFALLFWGFWAFSGSVFHNITNKSRLQISLLSTLIYFLTTPNLVQAAYYQSGAVCYQPAHILLLWLSAMLVNQKPVSGFDELSFSKLVSLAIKSAFIILIAGFNEVAMAFQLALLGGLSLVFFLENRKLNFEYAYLFFIGLIGAALIVFSPATFYRMEASQSFERSYGVVLWQSVAGFFEFLLQWLKVAAFSLLLVFWAMAKEKINLPVLKKSSLWVMSLSSFLLMIFSFAPSYLGEGVVQGRTANSLLFFFLFLFLVNMLFWKKKWETKAMVGSNSWQPYLPLAVVLLGFASPNSMQAWNDWLSGEGKAYHEEQMERIRLTETAAGDSVWVPPIVHRPKTIFFGDIGVFPQPWYDNYYARYHGKKFIHLMESEPKP